MGERPDPRLQAPAVARNREPILAVLRRVLPPAGLVLEVASGSGEHAAFFASALPLLTWQPSDPDPRARASIAAFRDAGGTPNLLPPLDLDVMAAAWPVTGAVAIVCINMIHIAPWSACEGLVAGAARALPPGGLLYLYGPYKEEGRHTAPSNEIFDADLRARPSAGRGRANPHRKSRCSARCGGPPPCTARKGREGRRAAAPAPRPPRALRRPTTARCGSC